MTTEYDVPFEFTGGIEKVTIDIKPGDQAAIDAADAANRQAAVKKALRD